MNFDYSNIVSLFEGLAGFTVAALAGCAGYCFWLQKRLTAQLAALESKTETGPGHSLEDQQGLAARVSAMQSSIAILQSVIAEMQNGSPASNSRSEDFRIQNSSSLSAKTRPADSDRRRPRFQTEWEGGTPTNPNRRSQMLRMHRRGESVPAIASALGISQGEVKLTVRLQELSSELPEEENSQDRF